MKVIAIVENSITDGGGFNQALSAILQISKLSKENFQFSVMTTKKDNIKTLKKLNIDSGFIRINTLDKIIGNLTLSKIGRRILIILNLIAPFEKKLVNLDCDLVYFVAPTSRCLYLQKLNYILTVWDISHRDTPEFPEVRNGEFLEREFLYKNYLSQAYLILVDSKVLLNRINQKYGIDNERMIVMPFSPNPMIEKEYSLANDDVMRIYGLEKGYFFYPAQFWAHKNHILIIEALSVLKNQNINYKVVFVGSDKGNIKYIKKCIKENNLQNDVFILGFVPSEHMRPLYECSKAVIMPTYFGPTNIPPLESWDLNIPIIYSDHLSKNIKSAVLPIDPDSVSSLAQAMNLICDPNVQNKLIENGKIKLEEISNLRCEAETLFLKSIIKFSKRLSTWKY